MSVRKLGLRRSGSLQNFTCGGSTGPFTLPYPIFGALALAVIVSPQPPSPLSLPAAHQRRRPTRSALPSPRLSECGRRPQATPHSPAQVYSYSTCQIHPRQPHLRVRLCPTPCRRMLTLCVGDGTQVHFCGKHTFNLAGRSDA
ncbi:hypothetical protein BC835DRAFT_411510 [Cytidiella melzeri]|nr:hypothetical protein BC835DRAFT_411510 [Cytidiella melzeri]